MEKEIALWKADRAIGKGVMGGIIVSFTTVAYLIMSMAGILRGPAPNILAIFVEVSIVLILTYGVHKKSRSSAIALLLYWIASRVFLWLAQGYSGALFVIIAVLFGYFFFEGVRGTWQYHRLTCDTS